MQIENRVAMRYILILMKISEVVKGKLMKSLKSKM